MLDFEYIKFVMSKAEFWAAQDGITAYAASVSEFPEGTEAQNMLLLFIVALRG